MNVILNKQVVVSFRYNFFLHLVAIFLFKKNVINITHSRMIAFAVKLLLKLWIELSINM